MPPKWDPTSEYILGEMPLGAPLVAQTVFVIKKWAPSVPKVLPMIEKCTKNETEDLPDCEKHFQKWTLFGSRPSGLREALTIGAEKLYTYNDLEGAAAAPNPPHALSALPILRSRNVEGCGIP